MRLSRDDIEHGIFRLMKTFFSLLRYGAREPLILLAFVAFIGVVWLLAGMTEEVLEGDAAMIDEHLLLLFREAGDLSQTIGPFWMEEIMRDITALGGITLLTLAVTACFAGLMMAGQRARALYLVISIVTATALANALKYVIARPRPDIVPHAVEIYTHSFPSGHSMMATMVFMTLGALMARAQPAYKLKIYILGVAIFTSLLVGISRVYLGVHWPTDVAAGWMVGAACALFFWLLAQFLRQKKGWDL